VLNPNKKRAKAVKLGDAFHDKKVSHIHADVCKGLWSYEFDKQAEVKHHAPRQ
jgi:hypothetical protein